MGNCGRCICKLCNNHNGTICAGKVSEFYQNHCQHCLEVGKNIVESVYKCDAFQPHSEEETKKYAIKNHYEWILNKFYRKQFSHTAEDKEGSTL